MYIHSTPSTPNRRTILIHARTYPSVGALLPTSATLPLLLNLGPLQPLLMLGQHCHEICILNLLVRLLSFKTSDILLWLLFDCL